MLLVVHEAVVEHRPFLLAPLVQQRLLLQQRHRVPHQAVVGFELRQAVLGRGFHVRDVAGLVGLFVREHGDDRLELRLRPHVR